MIRDRFNLLCIRLYLYLTRIPIASSRRPRSRSTELLDSCKAFALRVVFPLPHLAPPCQQVVAEPKRVAHTSAAAAHLSALGPPATNDSKTSIERRHAETVQKANERNAYYEANKKQKKEQGRLTSAVGGSLRIMRDQMSVEKRKPEMSD